MSSPRSSTIDNGRVSTVATTARMAGQTGRDLPYGIIPNESSVKFNKRYEGSKLNLGYIAVLVVKDEDMALVSMSFKTVPWQIGKPVLEAMSKIAVAKGQNCMYSRQIHVRIY